MSNLVLGITGGIATGKSTIASKFEALGAARISADTVARDVLAPGSDTSRRVIEEFGAGIAVSVENAEIDRAKLGALIYSNETARIKLGEITHPPIHAILESEIKRERANPNITSVIVEIPLLFENHLESFVDKILTVACSEPTQLDRIMARWPTLTREEAVERVKSQMPLSVKVEKADYVIDTDWPEAQVDQAVLSLNESLKRK